MVQLRTFGPSLNVPDRKVTLPEADFLQNGPLSRRGLVASGWLKAQIQYSCTYWSYRRSCRVRYGPSAAAIMGAMNPAATAAAQNTPARYFFMMVLLRLHSRKSENGMGFGAPGQCSGRDST